MNDKPSWWDRPTTIKIETRSFKSNVQIYNKKYESTKNSSPSMKLSKSPHLKIQRPKTTSHFQRHRRGTSEQHARVILATRERGTQSVASQRYSDLLVESNLRSNQSLGIDVDRSVSVDRSWMQDSNSMFRSGAIQIEIQMKESLATVENHVSPNPFRSAVAFDSLTRIIPQLKPGMRRVMKMIALELLRSVYPSSNDSYTPLDSTPFFETSKLRGQSITKLTTEINKLNNQYDILLAAQMASSGSINCVVNRWRKKYLNASFNTWRTVAFVRKQLKHNASLLLRKKLTRKRFNNIFFRWKMFSMKQILERSRMESLVVNEQNSELVRSALIIKELRKELSERKEEIVTLVKENSALKMMVFSPVKEENIESITVNEVENVGVESQMIVEEEKKNENGELIEGKEGRESDLINSMNA
jgi:hypothetical protein